MKNFILSLFVIPLGLPLLSLRLPLRIELAQSLPARFRGLHLFYLSALASTLAPLPNKKADQTIV